MAQSSEDILSIISDAEQRHGIPQGELLKIAQIESSLNPKAQSGKGAKGLFQFIDSTGKAYGVNDPFDPVQSAEGAARYWKDLDKQFKGNRAEMVAQYNGGGKAVAALRAGTPWAETQDYLNKFGSSPAVGQSQPAQETLKLGRVEPATQGPNAAAMEMAQKRRDQEYGGVVNQVSHLPRALALGFEEENSVFNYFANQYIEGAADPNFKLTNDVTKELLKDIPEDNWNYILEGSSSLENLQRRKWRVQESLANQAELGKMGFVGVAGRLTGALVDLPTLLAAVPVVGDVALVSKTSRVANAIATGLAWSATNAAYEAGAYKQRPLGTFEDVKYAALFGLAFGNVFGGLAKPGRGISRLFDQELKALEGGAAREFNLGLKRDIEESGATLTDTGRKLLDEGFSVTPAEPPPPTRIGAAEWFDELRRIDESITATRGSGAPRRDLTTPEVTTGRSDEWDWGTQYTGLFKNPVEARATATLQKLSDNLDSLSKGKYDGIHVDDAGNLFGKSRTAQSKLTDLEAVGIKTLDDLKEAARVLKQATSLDNFMRMKPTETARSVLTRIINNASDVAGDHASLKTLAKRLMSQLKEDVEVVVTKDSRAFGKGTSAYYSPGGHTIYLRPEHVQPGGFGTALHEISHAATVYKLEYGAKNLDTSLGKLYKELEEIRSFAAKEYNKSGSGNFNTKYYLNGARNGDKLSAIKEFVAGIYSGRTDFLEHLNKLEWKGKGNLLTRVWDIIKDALGLTVNEASALRRSIEIVDELNNTGLKTNINVGGKGTTRSIVAQPEYVAAHPGVSPELAKAATDAEIPIVFGWGLGLEHKLLGPKAFGGVRQLAAKLFGTTVGYKDHSVVGAHAWDDTSRWYTGWRTEASEVANTQFQKFMGDNNVNVRGRSQAWEDFNSQISDYIRGFEGEYPDTVKAVGDKLRKLMGEDILNRINNPMLDEGGVKRGLTQREVKDPETGEVTLTNPLERYDTYMPRKHDPLKWNSVASKFGRDSVEGYFARSFKAANDNVSDEAAERFGKWYVQAYEDAHINRTLDNFEDMLRGTEREALKDSLITHGGFDPYAADTLLDNMFPKKGSDSGATNSSLKRRNLLSESYKEEIRLPDGTTRTLSLNDFVNTNAMDVFESYARRMAGSISLAKHADVYTQQEIQKAIGNATKVSLGDPQLNPGDIAKMREHLQFAFDRILGLPQEHQTWLTKTGEMFRSFNVMRLMGGAVFNQVVENGQILGSMGFKAVSSAVPEYSRIMKAIKAGTADEEVTFFKKLMSDLGSSYVARMDFKGSDDWTRMLGEGSTYAKYLDATDTALRKGAKAVLDYTGMTPVMLMQRRVHAVALVNHLVDVAKKYKGADSFGSDLFTKERLAWMGMSEKDFSELLGALKSSAKVSKGETKIAWEKFAKDYPALNSKMHVMVHRESRRVIQENDLGAMIPVMGKGWAQTMFQFQNFTFQAWNKAMLFGLNHRDTSTLLTVMYSSLIASGAYTARMSLNSLGMSDLERDLYLEKRLNPQQIVANSFGRINQASLLPQLIDTLSPQPIFSGLRTTSDIASLASNPTLGLLDTLVNTKKLIRNSYSDEYQTSQRDVKSMLKLVPLNNVVPISSVINAVAEEYPRSETQ